MRTFKMYLALLCFVGSLVWGFYRTCFDVNFLGIYLNDNAAVMPQIAIHMVPSDWLVLGIFVMSALILVHQEESKKPNHACFFCVIGVMACDIVLTSMIGLISPRADIASKQEGLRR